MPKLFEYFRFYTHLHIIRVVLCKAALTALYRTWSRSFTPEMVLRHHILHSSYMLLPSVVMIYISVANAAVKRMNTLYNHTFSKLFVCLAFLPNWDFQFIKSCQRCPSFHGYRVIGKSLINF